MRFYQRSFRFSLVILITLAINAYYCSSASTMPKKTGNLIIEITGLRNQKGLVCIALFDRPEGFPSDETKAISNDCFEIVSQPLQIKLNQIEYGRYALSVLHDENKDGKLNTGFIGIPKEGMGFSQNPRIKRRLPFQETSFEFQQNSTPTQIMMKYF